MSPFLASPGPPSSGGAASSRRLWSGVRAMREQNQRRPDPRHEEGGQGDGLEWDPVTRWQCGPHPPDLCPGRPGPGPLLGTAGAKTVLKAMPLSFAVLTDLRVPERQCPAHSPTPPEGARLVVRYLPTAVRARPRPMPPATHAAPRSSVHCPPPTVPNGCRGWTAFGSWQSGPFHTPPSSLPLSRTGTPPPPPPDMFLPQVFCEQQLSQADGRSVAAARCGTVRRCQRGTQLGRSRATGGCSFVFVVRRAPTRYGGGARSHLYIAEHVRVTGIRRRIQSIQDAMASTTHGCGPSYMTTEIATDGPCGRPYIS